MPLYQPADLNTPVLSQFSLKGKTAIVTGGSGGIGRQIVTGLAEAGADVAFTYRTSTQAAETAAKIAAATGARVVAHQCEVTDREATARTINDITHTFGNGRLDILVVNAGVCANIPSLEYKEESWEYINRVNYDGVMWAALAAGKIFKELGKGNFIITASVSAAFVNVPQTQVSYNASKAAALQLGRSLAVEWADFARVNCVSPGYVLTEMLTKQPTELMDKWLAMIPGGRVCNPVELKSLYVFLASDACSYMTGANLIVDGRLTLP